ncbi:Beta-hexosaminidase [Smittium culicis]|uniref:beta-N-acetylhexosaminidase n=2 Tax=Smittium culicis TaxID=133412 RepID=A0A1R1YPS4_9FUNG|nr:Beta-hexosaminidase [Smittium culicis]
MKLSAIFSVSVGLVALVNAADYTKKSYDNCVKCGSIACIVSKMTLEEKITQKLMPDLRFWKVGDCNATQVPVTTLLPELQDIHAQYKFGGVILFAENVPLANQTTRLTRQLQDANRKGNKIPLLISVDQEGGIVTRLGRGTMFPGNMAMAATGNSDYTYQVAQDIAEEVGAVGLNVNFGPVADVNLNPNNPVIGVRSFSSNVDVVTEHANKYYQGIKSKNVISCAKHFPGHGDTDVDSHFGLPLVDKPLDVINKVELAPFRSLVSNGIDMIMTAHIQYPAIDNSTIPSLVDGSPIVVPSSLSRKIITDLLKKQMNFGGVVITDAMNMDALLKYVGFEESLSLAFRAGTDIACMPTIVRCYQERAFYDNLIARIKKDVADGLITVEEIDESVTRILKLKKKYGLLKYDDSDINEKVAISESLVNNPVNKAFEKKVAEDAITLLRNDPTYGIPFKPAATEKVLFLTTDNTQSSAVNRYIREIGVDAIISTANYNSAVYNSTWDPLIDNADYIVLHSLVTKNTPAIDGGDVFIEDKSPNTWAFTFPQNVLKRALDKKKKMVVVSLRNPYDTANFETAPAVLCAYGFKGILNDVYAQPNIPAAISTIFGKSSPKGKLTVDIFSIYNNQTILYPFGFGITY